MNARETYEALVSQALAVSVAAGIWSRCVDQQQAAALTALAEHLTNAIADATVGHLTDQRLRALRADTDRHPVVRVALGYAAEGHRPQP